MDLWKTQDEFARPPPGAGPTKKIRILLVDDNAIVLTGIARFLETHADLQVIGMAAADGAKAIELARRAQPDVIVMDVRMPGLGGVEATRRIVSELPKVRIIGLSTDPEPETEQAMRQAGAVAYLTKDCDPSELLAAVRGQIQAGNPPR